jgi:cytochrome c biogenesis factor
MYNELGHYFLILGISVVLTYNKRPAAVSLFFFFSTFSFFGILFCYISSDFSNYNVFTNSNVNAPLFHKISRTWSNHEGSLLLWIYFWLSGSTLQYFKMTVQQKYISFLQAAGGFSLCFFYKKRKYKI